MGTVHIGTVVGSVFGNVTQYIQKEELKDLEGVKEVKEVIADTFLNTNQKVLALTPSNSSKELEELEGVKGVKPNVLDTDSEELKELEELEGVKANTLLNTNQKVLALTPSNSSNSSKDNSSNSFNSFNSSENIPPELATERAGRLRERLEGAGLVDAHWQPVGLSLAEKGVLVQYVAGELGLAAQWKTFARLWGMNPETLRKAYGKGMEQKKTLAFWERVKG